MKFSIGTVLSITHKILLCEMDDIYKILNYMLDENLYTYQLPRAAIFCQNYIREQHPQLDKWDSINGENIDINNWQEYLTKAEQLFGKELEISKLPSGIWQHKDAINELKEMVGDDGKITIINLQGKILEN